MPQGSALSSANLEVMFASNLTNTDGSWFAVPIGMFLGTVALSAGIPAVRLVWLLRRVPTLGSRLRRAAGAVLLLAMALPAGGAGGWMLWHAYRGDFAPYADVRGHARPSCRASADAMGLKGDAKSHDVDACIRRAVEAAAD